MFRPQSGLSVLRRNNLAYRPRHKCHSLRYFFGGGKPGELLDLVLHHRVEAVATSKILAEYQATIDYLLERYKEKELHLSLRPIFTAMVIIPQTDDIKICRDPDDDKFLSCAVDGKCIYIVSGDKDLLTLKCYENVEIVTVSHFLDLYFTKNTSPH